MAKTVSKGERRISPEMTVLDVLNRNRHTENRPRLPCYNFIPVVKAPIQCALEHGSGGLRARKVPIVDETVYVLVTTGKLVNGNIFEGASYGEGKSNG
ncbi:MAG: hypothetical protein JSW12_01565 [Deltaproteobacteria bacterium]|nr:MAG: hypothetical protein JSW12_01565 [Deltaproteobacteria bacterium]